MSNLIASAIGIGIGVTMLIYPIVFLILKGIYKIQYKWTKFLLGFGIAAVLSGFTITFVELFISKEIIFLSILIPATLSIFVVLILNKKIA